MVFTSATDEHAAKRHHALTASIQQEADRRGFISFARFMELALYAPGLGFYEHRGKAIGRTGDFFTSVSVGPLFGELLACQFARWMGKLAIPKPVIVEAGAHDGRLALDILATLRTLAPPLMKHLEYWVIEPSPERQGWQRETLRDHLQQMRWFQSWTELSSFCDRAGHGLTGVILTNELLDALPVHRLRWNRPEQAWKELCVRPMGNQLTWIEREPGAEVTAYAELVRGLDFVPDEIPLWPCLPAPLSSALPDGFTIEICPAALQWWREAAAVLTQGWLLTFDYGLLAGEVFAPHRCAGTIRSYQQHRCIDDVLLTPGQQDITAHANFSAVQLVGEAAGLATENLCGQGEFLTHVLQKCWPITTRPFTHDQARQFQTLTHPQHLGRSFRALVQSRGIGRGEPSS